LHQLDPDRHNESNPTQWSRDHHNRIGKILKEICFKNACDGLHHSEQGGSEPQPVHKSGFLPQVALPLQKLEGVVYGAIALIDQLKVIASDCPEAT